MQDNTGDLMDVLQDPQFRRLKWRCQRGMLELDLFLVPFIEQEYANLSEGDREIFQMLLEQTDPELYAWLTKKALAPELYQGLIQQIILFRENLSAQ